MVEVRHKYMLVGIETDPTRYHGENASHPALLESGASEKVLVSIAADLEALFPVVEHCSLSMAGALFDQAQILRPRLPVYGALETLQQSTYPGSEFQPRLLGIGASKGQMPLKELQPSETLQPGLLQILPLLVSGPIDDIEKLASEVKHGSPGQAHLSARSSKSLEEHFQISVNQARFMVLTDLNTLLCRQLEQFGLLPLWELLDTAMSTPDDVLEVVTPGGLRFKWKDGVVHSFFESFDWWAKHGGGVDVPAPDGQLQSAYADWTREYRRYQTTLDAHGVTLSQHLTGLEDTELEDSFLLEESTPVPGQAAIAVTEHSADELGTVAVTVVYGERQMNFYPLRASGLNDLHRFIREQGYSGNIAFPGRICYDEISRRLVPDNLPR